MRKVARIMSRDSACGLRFLRSPKDSYGLRFLKPYIEILLMV